MIHGIDMSGMVEAAKQQVMTLFVARAEADKTPPTMRAYYVLKLQAAIRVLDGQPDEEITYEADLKGMTDKELAQLIVRMAAPSNTLERERMGYNARLEKAKSPGEIVRILNELGLTVSVKSLVTGSATAA